MGRQYNGNGYELTRIAIAAWFAFYKCAIYFVSFIGPVLVIFYLRPLSPAIFLALAIVGFEVAGLIFLSLLILVKKLIVGPLTKTGSINFDARYGRMWFLASVSNTMLTESPFWSMTTGLSPLGRLLYCGMGAKISKGLLMGARSRIADPWFVEVGENVLIGAEAVILGHLGHGDEVILGRVIIGDGAIIGMRAIILPDVRIGKSARIGAGAVVVRGTIIGDGETWAGVPAQRIAAKSKAVAGV